ncbi:hypothetical protein FWF89_00670 [Candidatus Saccharibacteria bacterium]|nr:hypothetical protein [Candidatus Saccharibacteria bacterium]
MYFHNRQALGDELAQKLKNFRDNDSIIMCIDPNSLLACIELAAMLHAYIFIIYYETISDPYALGRTLGVVIESGEFVLNPDISNQEYQYIYMNFSSQIDQAKREAISRLNKTKQENSIERTFINDRNVLLTDDIFREFMGVAIAKTLLKPLRPAHIEGVAGNIIPDTSTRLYLETQGTTYLDVIASNIFDDDHYFDEPDNYTAEQKIELAKRISDYWT